MRPFTGRFLRAVGGLLLALLNATLILVILAALSVGYAAYALLDVSENAARRTAEAALSAAGIERGEIGTRLDTLAAELGRLQASPDGDGLRAAVEGTTVQLQAVRGSLEQISHPEIEISEATVKRISEAAKDVVRAVSGLEVCEGSEPTAAATSVPYAVAALARPGGDGEGGDGR